MHMRRLAPAASPALLLVLLASLVPSPRAAQAAVGFTVDSGADAVDAMPGDGTCATASGACTLRAAIQEANALAGADTILLGAIDHSLTLAGADEDAAATGDLDVTSVLVLEGAGREVTSIVQTTAERVFEVFSDGDLTARDLRIEGGAAEALSFPYGGGALNRGVLELVDVDVTESSAGEGGGVFNGGTLVLDGCAVTGNEAVEPSGTTGGGIANGSTSVVFASPEAEIVASAIYGNVGRTAELESANADVLTVEATTFGPGDVDALQAVRLYNTAAATLSDVTALGRFQAAAFDVGGTDLTLRNTALATCSIGAEVVQTNEGVNAARDGSCMLDSGAIVADPLELAALGDHGGPTATAPPLRSSPLVDAGALCAALDQRGEARPQDGDGDGSAACDVGAVELPEPGAVGALVAIATLGALRRGRRA